MCSLFIGKLIKFLIKIDFESRVEYGGESLFSDDFRYRDRKNFKEIFKDVKVSKGESCNESNCLIENERF